MPFAHSDVSLPMMQAPADAAAIKRDKLEGGRRLVLRTEFEPAGDQPAAIAELTEGVQAGAFAQLCPAVTVECGQPGQPFGVDHALEYLSACLNLAEIPTHPVAAHDISLYRTVAIVKVPQTVSFSFSADDTDIRFNDNLDHMNFRELPAGTLLGRVRPGSSARLEVIDSDDREVSDRYLRIDNGEIRTAVPVMPSMLTLSERAIRQDCLGYFMENRRELFDNLLHPPQDAGPG